MTPSHYQAFTQVSNHVAYCSVQQTEVITSQRKPQPADVSSMLLKVIQVQVRIPNAI